MKFREDGAELWNFFSGIYHIPYLRLARSHIVNNETFESIERIRFGRFHKPLALTHTWINDTVYIMCLSIEKVNDTDKYKISSFDWFDWNWILKIILFSRADYWKSQARKYCDFCKCWISDNKASVDFHEGGKKHKENVSKRLKEIHKNSAKQAKQQKKFDSDMEKMEKVRTVFRSYKLMFVITCKKSKRIPDGESKSKVTFRL